MPEDYNLVVMIKREEWEEMERKYRREDETEEEEREAIDAEEENREVKKHILKKVLEEIRKCR